MRRILFCLCLSLAWAGSMPSTITNYTQQVYVTPTATMMRDSITPTVMILSSTEDTYEKEKSDMRVTVNIQKNSVLESMRQAFVLRQKIELEALQIDVINVSKSSSNQLSLEELGVGK